VYEVLDAIATFRKTHFGWARQCIRARVGDPRGTGGTPHMQWLKQPIDEARLATLTRAGGR
jgi:indoleamine 2,3-dioxygenase